MLLSHPLLHRVVAGYCLTEYVGAGGMGEVFKAVHLEMGRTAAVKVLYRPEFAARFRNEAHIQASLSHPNIATLYEYGLLDNRPALVMEWVDGQSLDELIRHRSKLTNDELLRIAKQIVAAVGHLHQKGIIHRDLKPSNVRVRPDGQVKLLDFGIAKGRYTPQLTQVGHVVGTTEFMAPEQFRAQVELKSDSWALGVLLYEMATGYLPFDEANPLLLRKAIERGQYTSPLLLNPTLSPTIVSLIANCLQTNPARRPDALEVQQMLQEQKTGKVATNLMHIGSFQILSAIQWPVALRYGLLTLAIGLIAISLFKTEPKKEEITGDIPVKPVAPFEQIRIEVLNADYDLELVLPDGTVQSKEPFVVKRTPGKAFPIIIRHQGAEQQFVIDPDVRDLYQCYFDR
ncbi:serine/threonine-protein kinase [Spirosoma sp. SC4-14]|uniref:serine/threonine-protein kinase n=1 Tax=Spirosoma sp. SC4-14 TaxID=3128900 RepID=UPI0030CB3938